MFKKMASAAKRAYLQMKETVQVIAVAGAVAVGSSLGVVADAQAALPTEATAVFTSLSGTVTDVSAAIWPIIGAVMILFLTIKLVRKGANKI